MRALSEKQFLGWAKSRGIDVDANYPKNAILAFVHDSNEDRFWEVPAEVERRPYFVLSLLELMGDWQSCFVWRHMGSWPASADPQRINDNVELEILTGLGLPLGTSDVVEFMHSEHTKLVTLLFATTIFGWSIGEDIYVVPDHGRFILKTDHHNVVHVSFKNAGDREAFVTEMSKRKFSLPEELPDNTFKRPAWMKSQ